MCARPITAQLIEIYQKQSAALETLDYHPFTMYNPLAYAFQPFKKYIELCGESGIRALYLGMNPGPWGMAQTGVPFGEIESVVSWMGIRGEVGLPHRILEKRPILGYALKRREVSGKRLWGFFADHFETATRFFAHNIVLNYCPLLFFDNKARNITPPTLHKALRLHVEAICDRTLQDVLDLLKPKFCIGIGVYAYNRLQTSINLEQGRSLQAIPEILRIPHPSPANPSANKNWADQCTKILHHLL